MVAQTSWSCSRNRANGSPVFLPRSPTKSVSARSLVQTGARDFPTLAAGTKRPFRKHNRQNEQSGTTRGPDLRGRRFECREICLASRGEPITALERFGQAERLESADPELVRPAFLAGLRGELGRHHTR